MMKMKQTVFMTVIGLLLIFTAACGQDAGGANGKGDGKQVSIDGSSTVYPIMRAVSEEFVKDHKDTRAPVGVSGTGGGFEKFLKGETHLNNASRPIKSEEKELAEKNGIDYIELTLAYDGLSVVVNKENDWVDFLTVEELNKMWKKDGGVTTWSDVREGWPDEPILFFSPGTDSGTFDYWNGAILEEKPMRRGENITLSEKDNTLVQGVAKSKYSIGYFGYSYYSENKDKLKIVPIDNGEGKPVQPTLETIQSKTYEPLSRPLFTYVNLESLKNNNETVYEYVIFTLKNAGELAEQTGYVGLPEEKYQNQIDMIKDKVGK